MIRKNLIFSFAILVLICVSLIALELASIAGLYLWELKSTINSPVIKKSAHEKQPIEMSFMQAGDIVPFIRTHQEFSSSKNNTLNSGFRGGQSSFDIIKNSTFDYVASSKTKLGKSQTIFAFIGGSTTFGIDATDQGTFPAQFEAITKIPSINLGLGGNYLRGEGLVIEEFFKTGFRPHSLVHLNGINEDWCFFPIKSLNEGWEAKSWKSRELAQGAKYSSEILARKLHDRFWVSSKKNLEISSIQPEDCAESYLRNIRHIAKVSAAYDVKNIYIILQPSIYTENFNSSGESIEWNARKNFYNTFYNSVLANQKAIGQNKELEILVIDGRKWFEGENLNLIYSDGIHLTDYGNKLLAKKFTTYLNQPY